MQAPGSVATKPPFLCATAQPMFYAAIAFSLGIAMARWAWRPPLWWMVAAVVCLMAAVFWLRRYAFAAFLLALASLVTLGALSLDYDRAVPTPVPSLIQFTDGERRVVGHVIRSGLVRERERDQSQTLDVQTEQIDGQRLSVGVRVNAYAAYHRDTLERAPLRFGDRIAFPAHLREPRNFGDPGAMDYRGYLQARGLQLVASVKAEAIESLPGKSGARLEFWRSRARQSLIEHMLALRSTGPVALSLDKEEVGLLAAMIIGEQSLIRRDTRTDFQRTGVFHVLVVSGMNVGILAFVIFGAAKWLRAGEYFATAATIVLSLLYAYMTDLGAPIMRAAVMLSLFLAARLLYRERYSLNATGTAALALLAWDPQALFDASFQLTFLSVTALGGIAQPLIERMSRPFNQALYGLEIIGYDATLAPKQAQLRLDLRMIAERLARMSGLSAPFCGRVLVLAGTGGIAVFNLALVTVVLQFALALPMVYYFHRIALLGSPANLLVIPLASILMPMGILATLLSYVAPALAHLPAAGTALLLHAITSIVEVFGGARLAELRVATPSLPIMAFAAAAFVFATFTTQRPPRIAGTGLVLLAVATLCLAVPPKTQLRPGVLEVTVLDVGQGDSILVVSPDGRTLLVDGGGPLGFNRSDGFEIGEDVVSPYLWSRRITRLDAVALSHPHSDHMGGLRSVIANFHPGELWLGGEADSPADRALVDLARIRGTRVVHRSAGDTVVFGHLQVRVLAPSKTTVLGPNDESLVLEVRYRNSSALLTGDAERLSELEIARALQPVDVLKVAHHGSATSTTPELLASARPRVAAVSAGYRNLYGHPKPEVMQRLTAAGIRTFRTDLNGALTFYLDGEQVTATTFSESH